MAYKYPQTVIIQKIAPSPQVSFPKVHFLFPSITPSSSPSHLPLFLPFLSGIQGQEMNSCLCHFIRQFPRANELQPWLWNGSVNLINDWGSATITSPSASPKCTHSPAGKEEASKEHQRALFKHKHHGQSQTSKASLPWEPAPAPDRKGFPHVLFRKAEADEEAEGEKFQYRTFHRLLDKVVGSPQNPIFLRNTYIKMQIGKETALNSS